MSNDSHGSSKLRSLTPSPSPEERGELPSPFGRRAGNEGAFPWRSVLAVILAVCAQILLEPPGRRFGFAIPLYILAAGLTIWSAIKNEWELPPLPVQFNNTETFQLRAIPLLLSMPFMLAAFWAFGGGKFTRFNIALWLAALALLIFGLWARRAKEAAPVKTPEERARGLMWFALIIAVFGMVVFFRLNQIDDVPGEPFSDHAEKILDVYDISKGQYNIFFLRNTGREAIQMYWSLLVAKIFGTGFTFLTLKLGTALFGILTLPYIYLLGKEFGSPRAGLFALFLFGISYWPNVISRIGLRFPLYPFFLAPTLLYLTRGLRTRSRNDFLFCGIFLGLGLHGYSPFRIAPFLVLAAFAIYVLRSQSKGTRQQAAWWLTITGVISLIIFLPLLHYALDHPDIFSYRAFSRLGNVETNLPGSTWKVFFYNLGRGLLMFNWDDGGIWVNSLPHRPALDVVTGALFVIGLILLIVRCVRQRDWRDLLLLVSIPILLLPSVLSLAFPEENPALNRAGGAAVSAILVSALALDGLVSTVGVEKKRVFVAYGLTGILLAASVIQNYDLVFRQFNEKYLLGVWNTSAMGEIISEFRTGYGQTDTVWIVPYSQWVDTRLPGMWAGIPNRDFALWPKDFASTTKIPGPKLFIFHPEDADTENALKVLYPNGALSRYTLAVPGKDFMVLFVER